MGRTTAAGCCALLACTGAGRRARAPTFQSSGPQPAQQDQTESNCGDELVTYTSTYRISDQLVTYSNDQYIKYSSDELVTYKSDELVTYSCDELVTCGWLHTEVMNWLHTELVTYTSDDLVTYCSNELVTYTSDDGHTPLS